MTNARSLRVFLGSSITELEDERVSISDSISQDLTRLFEQDDIIIQFLKCESIHEGNDGTSDQDKIDEMLRECDVSLFLFKDKEGAYTLHEYETARALQKEKKHKIYVYYLRKGGEKKPEELTPFQDQLMKDGVFWKKCDSLSEIKYMFALGLLKNLGVHTENRTVEDIKKDGDSLFEQYESTECQQIEKRNRLHVEIAKLLAQVDIVLSDNKSPIASKIIQVIGIYRKADSWASKTKYKEEKYFELLSEYVNFLHDYGVYKDAEEICLKQIALVNDYFGIEHINAVRSYNDLCSIYLSQRNDDEAIHYLEKTLKILKKDKRVADKPYLAKTYDNLGVAFWHKNEIRKAILFHKRALKIFKKYLGYNNIETAKTYNNLGTDYFDNGQYNSALNCYIKSLDIKEIVCKMDSPTIAFSYTNIGMVYCRKCMYSEALNNYLKALSIREKQIGENHPDTAATYNNIGQVFRLKKKYIEALIYFEKALSIRIQKLGDNHMSTATSYNNIGFVYYEQKEYDKALDYLKKSLTICKYSPGENHPYTATVIMNIGRVYFEIGDAITSLEYMEKALSIYKIVYKPIHKTIRETQKTVKKIKYSIKRAERKKPFWQRLTGK